MKFFDVSVKIKAGVVRPGPVRQQREASLRLKIFTFSPSAGGEEQQLNLHAGGRDIKPWYYGREETRLRRASALVYGMNSST
jgi:hypothetical protein